MRRTYSNGMEKEQEPGNRAHQRGERHTRAPRVRQLTGLLARKRSFTRSTRMRALLLFAGGHRAGAGRQNRPPQFGTTHHEIAISPEVQFPTRYHKHPERSFRQVMDDHLASCKARGPKKPRRPGSTATPTRSSNSFESASHGSTTAPRCPAMASGPSWRQTSSWPAITSAATAAPPP